MQKQNDIVDSEVEEVHPIKSTKRLKTAESVNIEEIL
jgi:hypothetical protein